MKSFIRRAIFLAVLLATGATILGACFGQVERDAAGPDVETTESTADVAQGVSFLWGQRAMITVEGERVDTGEWSAQYAVQVDRVQQVATLNGEPGVCLHVIGEIEAVQVDTANGLGHLIHLPVAVVADGVRLAVDPVACQSPVDLIHSLQLATGGESSWGYVAYSPDGSDPLNWVGVGDLRWTS